MVPPGSAVLLGAKGNENHNAYEKFVSAAADVEALKPSSLSPGKGAKKGRKIVSNRRHSLGANGHSFMQVGEVLSIRNNGAVVSLGKDSKEQAFIPGMKDVEL